MTKTQLIENILRMEAEIIEKNISYEKIYEICDDIDVLCNIHEMMEIAIFDYKHMEIKVGDYVQSRTGNTTLKVACKNHYNKYVLIGYNNRGRAIRREVANLNNYIKVS